MVEVSSVLMHLCTVSHPDKLFLLFLFNYHVNITKKSFEIRVSNINNVQYMVLGFRDAFISRVQRNGLHPLHLMTHVLTSTG